MMKRISILFFPCLFLTACGIKGPLYLPEDPNDSYLSRIEKAIDEMTNDGTTVPGEVSTPESEISKEPSVDTESKPSENN